MSPNLLICGHQHTLHIHDIGKGDSRNVRDNVLGYMYMYRVTELVLFMSASIIVDDAAQAETRDQRVSPAFFK